MATDHSAVFDAFRTPPRAFSPVPTWWWSGEKIEADRLRWQLERYAEGGVYNLIVLNLAAAGPMHGCDADDPPFFSEAWWALFLGACEDAQRLGIRLWFYDQIGFSGANFQGRLVSARPEWAAQSLVSHVTAPGATEPGLPPQGRLLGCFPRADGAVRTVYTIDRGFDYFNAEACAALIDTVHGTFARRAGRFLGNTIAGSFQDELPNLPAWSPGFAAAFAESTGYSILDRLPALWEGDDAAAESVRHDYQRVRAELAGDAFFKPLFQWHERHGLLCGCDQQSPARAADPVGSTEKYADYARTHRWYSAPGSDHEGHAKLHSSLAHLYGRPRTWLEAFHSTGWGGTLEETFDWLLPWLRAGVTLYAPHADYYSTRGGWWEWAAPSTCWRQPYWKHYPLFAATVSRLCWLFTQGHHVCPLAVLYPSATVQGGLRQDGPDARAQAAQAAWHDLTGSMDWTRCRQGWIDGWNRDYDALDEDSLLRGEMSAGRLTIGHESFDTLILPACARLAAGVAPALLRVVEGGGLLIALGALPDTAPAEDAAALASLREAFAAGRAVFAPDRAACHAAVERRPAPLDAPVPLLHRCVDGLHVVLVTATSGMATTVGLPPRSWRARRAYRFDPARYAHALDVFLRGVHAAPFLLDPFDGARKDVAWTDTPEGVVATVPFETGPAQVLAWEEDLSQSRQVRQDEQEKQERGEPGVLARTSIVPTIGNPPEKSSNDWKNASAPREILLSNEWACELVPTADNRHGDFTRPPHEGAMPVQTWAFRHRIERATDDAVALGWQRDVDEFAEAPLVVATFGRYGWRRGPCPVDRLDSAAWEEAVYSLSRGLFKDPVHIETLGPKGHVPEDFIHFGTTRPGEVVQFRARVWMDAATRTHLALGAAGAKRAWINHQPASETSAGFLWLHPVALQQGWNEIVWEVRPEHEVNLRAYWVLVDDPGAFARPEWMKTVDAPRAGSRIQFTRAWTLSSPGTACELQLGCNAPCRLIVNGVEAGRQGGFDPYKIGMRVERYDLDGLHQGGNDIEIEVSDVGQPLVLLVDARTADGAVLTSGPGWWVARDGGSPRAAPLHRPQFKEISWSHLWRRPHPLPRVEWLDPQDAPGVVRAVIPDAPDDATVAEWLQWRLPPGARAMTLPGTVRPRVWVDDVACPVQEDRVTLPANGRIAIARIEPGPGRHGGGLLAGPVVYELGEGQIVCGDWAQQGLEAWSGGVRYRQRIPLSSLPAQAVLDLGRVRGTAEVCINGQPAGARFLSPYRFEVGGLLREGSNEVEITVYNTVASWLETHSPTRMIWDGTCASGLFGPVTLRQVTI